VPRVLVVLAEQGPDGFGYENQRWTTQRVADAIARLTDIHYSESSINELLRKWQWSWQKPKRRDSRRDEITIEHWREEF
jgi:putative transposase